MGLRLGLRATLSFADLAKFWDNLPQTDHKTGKVTNRLKSCCSERLALKDLEGRISYCCAFYRTTFVEREGNLFGGTVTCCTFCCELSDSSCVLWPGVNRTCTSCFTVLGFGIKLVKKKNFAEMTSSEVDVLKVIR